MICLRKASGKITGDGLKKTRACGRGKGVGSGMSELLDFMEDWLFMNQGRFAFLRVHSQKYQCEYERMYSRWPSLEIFDRKFITVDATVTQMRQTTIYETL